MDAGPDLFAGLLLHTAMETARQSHDLAWALNRVVGAVVLADLRHLLVQALLQLGEFRRAQILINSEIEVQRLVAASDRERGRDGQRLMQHQLLLNVGQASIALDEDHPAAVDVGIAGTPNLEPCGLGEVLRLGPPVRRFRQGWVHHDAEAVVGFLPQDGLHLILRNHPISDGEVHAAAATLLGWEQHEQPLTGGFCEL